MGWNEEKTKGERLCKKNNTFVLRRKRNEGGIKVKSLLIRESFEG